MTNFGQFAGTCKSPDPLYGYGQFPGHWSLGCRLEAQQNVICSLYNPGGADNGDVRNHSDSAGRIWEISPTESGADIQTLGHVAGIQGSQQLWRRCQPNQMDMFCRDRFRLELTRTSLSLFVNGQLYFSFGVTPGHSVPGVPQAGQLVPDDLFTRPDYTYFTTWVSAFSTEPSVRFHWGRIAVNPHNPDGSIMAPSASPSYCPGMPQNTCAMGMSPPMPTMMPTPSPTPNGASASPATATPSPTSAPASSGGGGGAPSAAFVPLPIVVPPTATLSPTAPPLVEPSVPPPLLRAMLTSDGAALVAGGLTFLVPAGGVGPSGAELVVAQVTADSMPAVGAGLQAGDVAVTASLTDPTTGQSITSLSPPMTVTYAPSDAELARAGGDLRHISLAVANGLGWEGLMCNPTGASLTCSLPRLGTLASVLAPSASGAADYDLPNGHFFAQRNGFGGAVALGFSVLDDADAQMWSEFQRLGGVDVLGYPISRRFLYRGSIVQALENGVLQWVPDAGQAVLMNTLDDLSAAGDDVWLNAAFQIPPGLDWSADRAMAEGDVATGHLGLLDAYPDVRAWLQANGSLDVWGLPTAVNASGSTLVVRFQRGTLQYWLSDSGLAPAGTTVFGSGAQLGKQVGLWPSEAMTPEAPPVAKTP
jgi:hypothetical protein